MEKVIILLIRIMSRVYVGQKVDLHVSNTGNFASFRFAEGQMFRWQMFRWAMSKGFS